MIDILSHRVDSLRPSRSWQGAGLRVGRFTPYHQRVRRCWMARTDAPRGRNGRRAFSARFLNFRDRRTPIVLPETSPRPSLPMLMPLAGTRVPSIFPTCGWVRKLRSEEHTSELQSLMRISYAVFCLTQKKQYLNRLTYNQQC